MCDCIECQYREELQTHLDAIPEEHRKFFDNLYEMYYQASFDAEYYRLIVNGQYPNSQEILEAHRGYKMYTLEEINAILKEKHGMEGLTIRGITPGTNPDATAEQVADEIAKTLLQMKEDFENGILKEADEADLD
jgi:hypothetical protein